MRFLRSLLLVSLSSGLLQAAPEAAKIPVLGASVKIDGKLDEAVWKQALPLTGFVALAAQAGVDPSLTSGYLWADNEAIYIGMHCASPEIASISQQKKARDEAVGVIDDAIEIFLDPEGRGFQYYQLIVNAGNSRVDHFWIESGMNQGGAWNPNWQSGVHRGADFYSVEVRIPISAFHFTRNEQFANEWLFNVSRSRAKGMEYTTWSPLRRGFHEPQSFRKVAGFPHKPKGSDISVVDVMATPIATADGTFPHQISARVIGSDAKQGPWQIHLSVGDGAAGVTKLTSVKEGQISLGNVTFPGVDQRYWITTQIKDANGQPCYEGSFRVASNRATLVNAVLDEPFYRNTIFPDQEITHLRGRITGIAEAAGHITDVALLLVSSEDDTHVGEPVSVKWQGKEVPFALPIDKLEPGNYRLEITLSGGKAEARESLPLRKLAPTKGGYSYIDASLNFVKNGKPTIARSVMGYGPKDFLISTAINENFKAAELPAGAFYHTDFIANAENSRVYPPSAGAMERSDDELPAELYAAYDQLIARYKDQPHVAYYLSDEPECRALSPVFLRRIYQYLREKDPYRSILIVSREPQLFIECADIISPHPYNNPSILESGRRVVEDSRKTAELIRRIYDSGKGRVQPWITSQLHTYSIADKNAVYPVFEEFFNPTMAAMTEGAKGIFPYVFYEQLNTLDMRLGVPFVFEFIQRTEDFWMAPPLSLKVEGAEGHIIATLRKANGTHFLCIVNLVPGEGTVTLSGEAVAALPEWYPYAGSEASIRRVGQNLQITVAGYGVEFFTSKLLHTNEESIPAFKKRLAEGNQQLAKPGNLLFGKRFDTLWRSTESSEYTPAEYLAETLTNGITDAIGFVSNATPTDIEIGMRKQALELNRLVLYSATVKKIKVSYWKAGEWHLFGEGESPDFEKIEISAPETVRTAKLRITLEENRPGLPVEVYEIEAYND